jgi:hypothetical protein
MATKKRSFKKIADAIIAAISEAVNQTLASKLTKKYKPNAPAKKRKVKAAKRKVKATRKKAAK